MGNNEQCKVKMQFDAKLAKEIGVEEAIMHSNIDYWVVKNEANNKHFHNGFFWTYNSQEAFSKMFTFWTEKQIKRILCNLEKNGLVLSDNFNEKKYDRTKWYTCVPEVLTEEQKAYIKQKSLSPNGQMEKPKRANAKDQTVAPIPDNKTHIQNTDVSSIRAISKKLQDSQKTNSSNSVKETEEEFGFDFDSPDVELQEARRAAQLAQEEKERLKQIKQAAKAKKRTSVALRTAGASEQSSGAWLNKKIGMWLNISPQSDKIFSNTTERRKLAELYDKYPEKEIDFIVNALSKTNNLTKDEFFWKVFLPSELLKYIDKWKVEFKSKMIKMEKEQNRVSYA
jgi:hypothetical protein